MIVNTKLTGHSLARFVFVLIALTNPVSIFAQQPNSPSQNSPRQVVTKPITITVTVTDKSGNPLPALPQSAFNVLHDKTAQEINSFDNEDAPASIAMVFDLSSSVHVSNLYNQKLENTLKALPRFLQAAHKSNEYFVVGFRDEAKLLVDSPLDAATTLEVINKIADVDLEGESAFFDACHLAIDKVKNGKYQKKALLLITDGEDSKSRNKLDDVLRQLKEENIVVYALDVGGDESRYRRPEEFPKRTSLEQLTDVSGGLLIKSKKIDEINGSVERLAMELRHQYILTVRPIEAVAPGKCYDFKIKVSPPADTQGKPKSLTVRIRESYCLKASTP